MFGDKLVNVIAKLFNVAGDQINPATEDKQALILAAINSIGGTATALTAGRKVVAVTNTAIVLGSAACKTVWINAIVGNGDVVVIGGASVVFTAASRTGKILYPGDGMTISIDNLDALYVNGTAGDGITMSYTT